MPAFLTLFSQALPARGATRHQAKRQINSITKQKATITLIHFACLIVVVATTAASSRGDEANNFRAFSRFGSDVDADADADADANATDLPLLLVALHCCYDFSPMPSFPFSFSIFTARASSALTAHQLVSAAFDFVAIRRHPPRYCKNLPKLVKKFAN